MSGKNRFTGLQQIWGSGHERGESGEKTTMATLKWDEMNLNPEMGRFSELPWKVGKEGLIW